MQSLDIGVLEVFIASFFLFDCIILFSLKKNRREVENKRTQTQHSNITPGRGKKTHEEHITLIPTLMEHTRT